MNGQEFKNIREILGLSQTRAGDLFYFGRQTVLNWEANTSTIPELVAAQMERLLIGEVVEKSGSQMADLIRRKVKSKEDIERFKRFLENC